MNSVKLSIITVNLNNLEGLKRTYESVVCQTFTDYEWIVIDGGSTDGSREFIEQHQDKFAYWCSEPDKGIYNAMTKGIVRAKGEYLNFMNSGDCFVSDKTLAKVFSREINVDILYGYVIEGNVFGKCTPSRMMKPDIYWYDLYLQTFPHQSSFIRRSLFSSIGLYEENCKIVADWKWFVIAILNHGASYEFLPDKIAVIQEGGVSSTTACLLERREQQKYIFPHYITEIDALNLVVLSIIQSNKFTYFLFKILKIISIRVNSICKNIQLPN